jgi:hypothetical protein
MRAVVLDEIEHAIALEHLVGRVFREREHVLGRIVFLLVDPTTFNANRIHEQREQGRRHSNLHFLGTGNCI